LVYRASNGTEIRRAHFGPPESFEDVSRVATDLTYAQTPEPVQLR